jgi:hypothetical protein
MVDKNVVDDYYSQIDSSGKEPNANNQANKTTSVVKKKIILIKPKVVQKKE